MSPVYSSELAAPQRMPDIDPQKPAMAGMLRMMALTHKKAKAEFLPPEDLQRKDITVLSDDGTEVPCIVIEPAGRDELLPGIIMIHGGAFYLPLQVYALILACSYARDLGARIILPEYRLVPGHAAPAQLEDCMSVWKKFSENGPAYGIDPGRILVGGDSAGAALAAGMCIALRDKGGRLPKGQLLLYPVLDNRSERYASCTRYAGEAGWTLKANQLMWAAYLKQTEDKMLPYLIPMRCADLSGLPPAYIEPQEIDILCDEACAYAEALRAAGVPAELNLISGSYHGFDKDTESPLVHRVLAQRVSAAREMLEH